MSNPHLTKKIAIIELSSQANILANLHAIANGVALACEQNATFVVLPENAFCFGNQAHAAPYFDALKDWCGKLARTLHIHLLAGTLPCPYRPDGTTVADGKFRQSSLLFDPAGDCVARYDKIHLFKATVNDSTGSYDEGKTFEAGNKLVVANTEFGTIGLMVCFDLRFPTLAVKLREQGADILTAPSAFTYQTGKAHWHSLLTARALDSQCLVIGAGQTGEHFFSNAKGQQSRETWGHSEFINANGEVIGQNIDTNSILTSENSALIDDLLESANWLDEEKEEAKHAILNQLILADFDIKAQQNWRNQINLAQSQRLTISDNIKI